MARLYTDEDFDYPVVQQLRAQGHDVLTVFEAGKSGENDAAVLSFAISQKRAVLTNNRRHFFRLHHQNPRHHGIIVCTRDQNFPALAARIHLAIAQVPSLDGRLIRIVRPPSSTR